MTVVYSPRRDISVDARPDTGHAESPATRDEVRDGLFACCDGAVFPARSLALPCLGLRMQMSPMTIMDHRGKWPRKLLRLWQGYEAVGVEVTFFHADDKGESKWDLDLPSWPWRWVCWIQGHSDSTYGDCVVCRKTLP